ncbi:MAG: signal peptidase I [Thermoguttaceae bacterium]|nr:signal peptidase I [Thermoguttaceae bacterium]MBR0192791.1 signal peptidase I [Thermoguttaceae bacterium]
MSTTKSTSTSDSAEAQTAAAPTEEQAPEQNLAASIRELFESIAIALILAFLFRTFLAEMFVIPTGSMAPTLMGQHKDVFCPECGAEFQVSVMAGHSTDYGLCPNCNCLMDFGAEAMKGHSNPNFSGDRILVGKYPYYFSGPKRWDVVVFLFPGGANTNFIKRCVGLPGETIRIHGGNVFIMPPKAQQEREAKENARVLARMKKNSSETVPVLNVDPFRIARKPPEKIVATMIPVYQNDFQSKLLRKVEAVPRWHQLNDAQIVNDTVDYTPWKVYDDGRQFYFNGKAGEQTGWLVYQNLVLSQEEWRQAEMGQKPDLKPRLITDMTAYNTYMSGGYGDESGLSSTQIPVPDYFYGRHWVKDLIVECTIDVRSLKTGEFRAGLSRGNRTFWCTINLKSGDVALEIPARPDFGTNVQKQLEYDQTNENKEEAYTTHSKCAMTSPNIYKFRMANVDDQIHVWIDGKVLKFDLPTAYKVDPESDVPTENDLQRPVQIGCKDCEVNLSHLSIYRDIYYVSRDREYSDLMSDFIRPALYGEFQVWQPDYDFFSDPSQWDAFRNMRTVEFKMDEEGERKYFMLGDNSTNSADCRCWSYPDYDPRRNAYVMEYYVPESLLIGEAYYVYWPHPWVSFCPNIKKFRKIK